MVLNVCWLLEIETGAEKLFYLSRDTPGTEPTEKENKVAIYCKSLVFRHFVGLCGAATRQENNRELDLRTVKL